MAPVMARGRVGHPDLSQPQPLLHGQRRLHALVVVAVVSRRTGLLAVDFDSSVRIAPESGEVSVPAHNATAAPAIAATAAAAAQTSHREERERERERRELLGFDRAKTDQAGSDRASRATHRFGGWSTDWWGRVVRYSVNTELYAA